jgi:hypothetical protein
MFEKEAEEYSNNWRINKKANLNFAELVELRAVIYKAYKDGATQETALLSQHILDLQKDKGNLTDRVRELEKQLIESAKAIGEGAERYVQLEEQYLELEQQIEKMKCCYNCKHSRTDYEHCKTDKHEKWEMKEE